MQEGGASFQTTHWTVVLEQAGDERSYESRRNALASFSEAYWPPLYTFVRRRGYSPADAQDIVQAFFVQLLEQNTLSRADRERGRLRTFLLTSVENFLHKQWERMRAIKRGGNQQMVSFDLHLPETEAAMLATSHLATLVPTTSRGRPALSREHGTTFEEKCIADGKGEWVDELRPFVAAGTAALPNQDEVANKLGTQVENLRVWLSRLRQRYRSALRAEVASTVSSILPTLMTNFTMFSEF